MLVALIACLLLLIVSAVVANTTADDFDRTAGVVILGAAIGIVASLGTDFDNFMDAKNQSLEDFVGTSHHVDTSSFKFDNHLMGISLNMDDGTLVYVEYSEEEEYDKAKVAFRNIRDER